MPLSEEELRLLEQMERALAEEDPRFVSALEGRNLARTARLRMALAAVAFLGAGAVVGIGMWQRMTWLGIIGFSVMVAAASVGFAQLRSHRLVARLGLPEPSSVEGFQGLRVIQGGRAARTPRAAGAHGPRGHQTHGGGSRLGRKYATWVNHLEARWLERRDRRDRGL